MSPEEARASLRVLVAVAFADGELAKGERSLLVGVAEKLGVDLKVDASAVRDVYDALSEIRSDDAKKLTFEAALALANVDGTCAPAEHALLVRIRDALAPASHIPLEKKERRWGSRMKEARARVDHESDVFLDQIAAAHGSLSTEAYQRMVADLDRKRSAILRDAVVE